MKINIRQKGGMNYLYADISVSGIRTKCTLSISLSDAKFNPKTQMVEGEAENTTNILINQYRTGILELIRGLQSSGNLNRATINQGVKSLRQSLTNPNIKEVKSYLIPYIENHIRLSALICKTGTIRQYNCSFGKLKAFERKQRVKFTFDDVNLTFYNEFTSFCMSQNLATNTIGTHVKNLKMWMNTAFEEGHHKNMIYRSRKFLIMNEPADTIYLNEDEIQMIRKAKLSFPHLERVRDLFFLACYTGVRAGDYDKLNQENIINDATMLKIRTDKTDETVIIPLHPEVKRILEKYNGTPPTISNQKFNEYIKRVCKEAKIDTPVTVVRTVGGKKSKITKPKCEFVSSHCARRSFATNAYKAGVPTLAIMAITGHRTEKVFLKYVRVSKEEHARIISTHRFFM
jgi:integrase